MHALLHADLRNQQRQNYNHELGLFDLFRRAYESAVAEQHIAPQEQARTQTFCMKMQRLADAATPDLDGHRLMVELRERFCGEHICRNEWLFEVLPCFISFLIALPCYRHLMAVLSWCDSMFAPRNR